MAEYVFVPNGTRVTSDAELPAPLFRKAAVSPKAASRKPAKAAGTTPKRAGKEA